ncbi:MAG: hypothetical protein E6G44_01000 [Actinobacteria bacterium]|nr:MAG: hypothetical protein E6G44_01000 [Actinomycetota bacterium]
MSVVRASVEVAAPPSTVWKVVSDPRNLTAWDHHIISVDGVPPDGLREGSRYRTWVRFMGVRAHADAEVLAFRPGRYAKVRLKGLVEGTVETWLEPLDGNRTLLRHEVDYRLIGGPLGRVAARGIKFLGASYLVRRGALAQKRQAEETGHRRPG